MKKKIALLAIFAFLFFNLFAGHQNCSTARVVCNITDQPSEGSLCNSGCSGNNNLVNGANSCFSGGLTRWGFYMFTIKQSGTLTFTINPDPPGFFDDGDYNFALFDVSNGCGSLGNALRCSQSYNGSDPAQNTGLDMSSTDTTEGTGGDGWLKYLDVQCGHTYLLGMDIPNNDGNGFSLSFGGTSQFGAPQTAFTATPDSVCAGQPVDFSIDTTACYVNNPFITYNWDFGVNATPSTFSGLTPPPVTFSVNGPQNIILTTEFTAGSTCSSTASQVVNVTSVPPSSTFTVSAPACVGSNVTITYTGNSPSAAAYTWSFGGATVISGSGQGPYTVQWSTPGTDTVTLIVDDCFSTSPTTSVTVTVTTSPTSTFNATSLVCVSANSIITYTGTGTLGDTYTWNFDSGNIVSGSGQGPYSVNWTTSGTKNITLLVTDVNGCISTTTILNVTVNPTPVANAGTDVAFCSGSSMAIGAAFTPGYTYSWLPTAGLSDASISNPTVIITNTGTSNIVTDYVVTATLSGCSASDSVQVTVYPLPTSTFSATGPVCVEQGSAITYTGNAGGGATYIWDFDSATVFSGSGQGPYLVSWDTSGTKTITLTVVQNGCISSTTTVITTVNPPTANAGPDINFCSGNTATIGISSNPGYTYSWSPATGLSSNTAANPTITLTNTTANPITTDYIVTTSFVGCTVEDTVAITVSPEPVSNAGIDVVFCSGDSALIGTSNNANYTYSWSPANGLSNSTVSGPTVSFLNSSATPLVVQYIVTTTISAYGCTSTDTVNVVVFQVPTSLFTASDSVCVSESATITYTGNATASASYTWNFGGGNASPGNGQGPHNVYWASAGTITVTLQVTENTCASPTTSSTIVIKQSPASNAGPDVAFCSGSSAMIGASSIPLYAYSWTPITGLSSATASNVTVTLTNSTNTIQTTNYIVTTFSFGCNTSDSVQVTVYPIPVAAFSPPSGGGQCLENNSFSLSAGGTFLPAATFQWNFGANASPQTSTTQDPNGIVYSTTGAQAVSLTIVQYGCTSNVYVDSVIVYPMPQIYFAVDDSLGCAPFIVNFFSNSISNGPSVYTWNFGDMFNISDTSLNNTSHTYQLQGTYYVSLTVTSADNCTASDTGTMISVIPNPVADFSFVPDIITNLNPVAEFTDQSFSSISSWNWSFGDGSSDTVQHPMHEYADTGTYIVREIVINTSGCSDTAYKTVIITPELIIHIPNAFNPNSDWEDNKYFMPKGFGFSNNFQMYIYNRWGDLIYETTDINRPWDGKANKGGRIAQEDVYVWIVYVRDNTGTGKMHQYIGHVTLVR